VVYAILMLAAILTMAGILLADLLYAWADPRVRFQKSDRS
jgi:peptide/nickel transport system permease protein